MERSVPIHRTRRLGFREQTAPRSETDMGPGDLTQLHSSSCAARRDSETVWMAYVPAHILDSAAKRRYRVQGDAGTVAPFLVTIHVRCFTRKRSRPQNMRLRRQCSPWYSVLKRPPAHSRKRCQILKAAHLKMAPIDEKGCKRGAKMHPFAPWLVSLKFVQLFWNEWRGRRDSNSRPLP